MSVYVAKSHKYGKTINTVINVNVTKNIPTSVDSRVQTLFHKQLFQNNFPQVVQHYYECICVMPRTFHMSLIHTWTHPVSFVVISPMLICVNLIPEPSPFFCLFFYKFAKISNFHLHVISSYWIFMSVCPM